MIYKLLTIDVWDTLLRRDCHPECIKLTTAQHIFLGWIDQIKPEFRDPWALYRARIDAELHLAKEAKRQGKDDEYEVTQVLTHWTDIVFSDPVTNNFPSELAEFELNTEIARSFPDLGIAEFLRLHVAEKVLFLSDFYMNATMLNRLLSAKGLNALVAEGISSCDVGFNKRSGQLFRHVHVLYDVSPAEHVHIGDNQWSDVESPRTLGVSAIHYLPEMAHAKRLERERLFLSRDTLFEHVRCECSALAEHASNGLSNKQASAFSFGAELAPLFIGFVLWIAEQAIVKKLDRFFFLTQEGEFFYRVFLALFPHGTFFGHNMPPYGVLAVSRLATFAPSMRNISIEEISRVWSLLKTQSVSDLFMAFGLNIENFPEILAEIGLKGSDVISSPERNRILNHLFHSQSFTDTIKYSVSTQQDLLLGYLKQNALRSDERVGIVDIGWRGTIQDNIALLMPRSYFHGMYLGLRRVINLQPANVFKSAYGPDENLSNAFSSFFESAATLEMLCSSPNGRVVGYSRESGQTIPQRHILEEENAAFENFTRYFQDGVLLAAKHWQPYLERYVVSGAELRSTALHIWNTMRRAPSKDLVGILMQTPQNNVFDYGELFKKNQLPSNTMFWAPILELLSKMVYGRIKLNFHLRNYLNIYRKKRK